MSSTSTEGEPEGEKPQCPPAGRARGGKGKGRSKAASAGQKKGSLKCSKVEQLRPLEKCESEPGSSTDTSQSEETKRIAQASAAWQAATAKGKKRTAQQVASDESSSLPEQSAATCGVELLEFGKWVMEKVLSADESNLLARKHAEEEAWLAKCISNCKRCNALYSFLCLPDLSSGSDHC